MTTLDDLPFTVPDGPDAPRPGAAPARDACWEWAGPRDRHGYGRVKRQGQSYFVHRLIWEALVGPIAAGLCVCHHCDNPPCVNPEHLFVGTKGDNNHDRDAKGRTSRGYSHAIACATPHGEDFPNAKLTDEAVAWLRATRTGRFGEQREMARRLGVHPSVISKVLSGKRWTHV